LELFLAVLGGTIQGITLIRDDRFLWLNQGFIEILGWDFGDLCGAGVESLFSDPHEFQRVKEQIGFAFRTQGQINIQYDFPHKDGHRVPCLLTGRPVDANDRSKGLVVSLTDFTEQERINRELKLEIEKRILAQEESAMAREDAEKANRAKSDFLAKMSHELRTPLNAIEGIAQLIRDRVDDPQSIELIEHLEQASRHLVALIGDILDFSKIESGKMELEYVRFDLWKLFDEVFSTLGYRAKDRDICLKLNLDPMTPRHRFGDPVRLKQIVFNLLGNSLKFLDRGNITVDVRPLEAHQNSEDILEIVVTDTGPGIPTEALKKIFGKFEQGTEGVRKGGTGLGLAITNELTKLMGGNIQVSSTIGRGTVFTVHVKLDEAPSVIEEQPELVVEPVRNRRALIADDVPVNRMVLRLLLKKNGWDVVEAQNGLEVLQILQGDVNFDVILMDISMPVMDGEMANQKIKESVSPIKEIPVLALTAHAFSSDRERFLKGGMQGYVSKPVRPVDLWGELNRVLKIK
jgi:PAS domain S-box-containing protein